LRSGWPAHRGKLNRVIWRNINVFRAMAESSLFIVRIFE